jgi:membrane fusion protein
LSSGELAALALGRDGAEPLYRVVVGLKRQSVLAYGKEEPLKPGMLVEADVLGETRKLWEWVMEPLFSVTGRSADN